MGKGRYISLLLLLFFVIRIATVLCVDDSAIRKQNSDSTQYNNYALTILKDSSWFYSSDFIGSKRAPGYPLFLALTYFLFGKENFIAVYILQALIGILTAFIIYRLALRIFNERTALIAFLWSGLYGFYVWYAGCILREILVIFFLALFFYLFYIYLTDVSGRKRKLFIAALAFTFLIHTDFRYIYLLPCIAILFAIYQGFLRSCKNFFFLLCIITVLSLPWAMRDYLTYDKIVIAKTFVVYPGAAKIEIAAGKKRYLRWATKTEVYDCSRKPDHLRADVYPFSTYWGRRWFNLRELWRVHMFGAIYTPFPKCEYRQWRLEKI